MFRAVTSLSFLVNSFALKRKAVFQAKAITELPLDFSDAVSKAVDSTVNALKKSRKCRIQFDPTASDQTYSILSTSLPFVKDYTNGLGVALGLPRIDENIQQNPTTFTNNNIKIFFPDMGAAMMVQNEWKVGSNTSSLQFNAVLANVLKDHVNQMDSIALIVCPLYSEVDAVRRVISECDDLGVACILINPNLNNPDQGFGVRKFHRHDFYYDINLLIFNRI